MPESALPVSLQVESPAAQLCAIMARDQPTIDTAICLLETRFGAVRDRSITFDFDGFSQYYADEMGDGLCKCVVCFEDLVQPSSLAAAKIATLAFEQQQAQPGGITLRRTVNIDPGILSMNSLVLATTKASGHRIAIAPSLYAEVTLLFSKGQYQPLPWSYQDYQSRPVQEFLLRQRQALLMGAGGAP